MGIQCAVGNVLIMVLTFEHTILVSFPCLQRKRNSDCYGKYFEKKKKC